MKDKFTEKNKSEKTIQKTILFIILIFIAQIIIGNFVLSGLFAYPPRDHMTWCFWCGGDGKIDFGDPPTITETLAESAYRIRFYLGARQTNFPYTNNGYTFPCKFELCGTNYLSKNYARYASTAIVQMVNCYECHNLSRRAISKRSIAINKKMDPKVNPDIKCDLCHNVKRFEGGGYSYDSISLWSKQNVGGNKYPQDFKTALHPYPVSAHPFRVINDNNTFTMINGEANSDKIQRKMDCSNCHDTTQVTMPNHMKYQSRFRVLGGDKGPDYNSDFPVDTSSMWKWMDTSGARLGLPTRPAGLSAPIGSVSDDYETASEFMPFKRKDGRAKAFYSINFCIQCHDNKGTYSGSINATFHTPDMTLGWDDNDAGHRIRQNGAYLKIGDRMPCTVCHDPHSSAQNPFLLKESLLVSGEINKNNPAETPLIPRDFCTRYCHADGNTSLSNLDSSTVYAYDTSWTVYGIKGEKIDPILKGIIIPYARKDVDTIPKKRFSLRKLMADGRGVKHHGKDEIISVDPPLTGRNFTCIGKDDFNRDAYAMVTPPDRYEYIINQNGRADIISAAAVKSAHNGCHSSGHNPGKISCEGCHSEEYDWQAFKSIGRPIYTRKQKMPRPGLGTPYTRHPVKVSISDKIVNRMDLDDEVKNWLLNPTIQQTLKEFLYDPDHDGNPLDGVIDTTLSWRNLPLDPLLGKGGWNPPELDGVDGLTCKSCHNDHNVENKNLAGTTLVPLTKTQAYLKMEMPYICMTCHPKGIVYDTSNPSNKFIRAAKNRHGGFFSIDANDTGKCDTCHSMHGRHALDSSRSYDLGYGMFETGAFPLASVKESPLGTNDTTWDGQQIYKDYRGKYYSRSKEIENNQNEPYPHLMHNRNQVMTCGKCHGAYLSNPSDSTYLWNLLGGPNTSMPDFRWPANIYYPAPNGPHASTKSFIGNYDREDTYFTTNVWRKEHSNNFVNVRRGGDSGGSEHDVDLFSEEAKAYSNVPASNSNRVNLRCGYCHDPHGNDNYVQLRDQLPISREPDQPFNTTWIYNGNESQMVGGVEMGDIFTPKYMKITGDNKSMTGVTPGDYRKYYYTTGISDFCTSCHIVLDDRAIEYHFPGMGPGGSDSTDRRRMFYATRDAQDFGYIGKDFERHPVNISMRTLINNIKYKRGDTTGVLESLARNLDTLVLQRECPKSQINTDPIIGEIMCLTCHNAHASKSKALRKGYDFGVNSCVNICHPYVKTRNQGPY